ncbi:MAG: KH domain-containing protein [Candidatus Marinimicrobia bacterium]|nr:KH domain-containing protein [Candidatus Neomarinimicrobiota bacterium]
MKELLEHIVKAIVDSPDEVKVKVVESDTTRIFELTVVKDDLGKVIGKRGKNVGAIRTLLSASNAKAGGKRAILEIIE